MKIFANIKYYLNYFYFNRGDTKIREYFSSNEYNNAIKELTEEGYFPMYLEFQDLVTIYSNLYPLNSEESLYITQVKKKFISKLNFPQDNEHYRRLIEFAENYIRSYKISDIGFEKEFKINFLKCELDSYKKELEKGIPITEAIILNKLVKILLEKLIIKNIDNIDIIDYIPNSIILSNYLKSLKSHYIIRDNDDINIENKLKEEIKISENYYERNKKDKIKKSPKINYIKENNITKIIETLFGIRAICNKIVCFSNQSFAEIKNINEIIDILEEPKNENDDKNIKISISKVAQFIAFGNPNNKIMKDLNFHYKKFCNDYNSLKQQKLSLFENYNINQFNDYKERILSAKETIDEELSHLVLSEYELNLKYHDIKYISRFFSENIFNLDNIQIDNVKIFGQSLKDEIYYFNELLKKMNIKQKLKFCLTLKENIELINIKRKINEIIPIFNKIEENENKTKEFNNKYKEVLQKLNDEINKINISTNFIERENIFTNISKEEFITIIEDIFKNETINFFDKEINNFYLFIYLLKNKIYDEISYKLALGISEN